MKRILIISDCPTHPVNAGNRMCINAYSKLLSDNGYDVYFLLVNANIQSIDFAETAQVWKDHFFYHRKTFLSRIKNKIVQTIPFLKKLIDIDFYYPDNLTGLVRRLNRKHKFNGVIINYIWLTKLSLHLKDIPVALFTHDVFSYRNERIGFNHWISCPPDQEAKCINRVTDILAIQKNEGIFFSYLAYNAPKIHIVYTPFYFTEPVITGNNNILFFSGSNQLNIISIVNFINNIFPYIRKEIPSVQLHIGGGICDILLKELANMPTDVILHGNYSDPADFYKLGDVAINPVSQGSGLKIKSFEALSFGKTVISAPHGTEGIFDSENCPIYIADQANEYINILKLILGNREKLIQNMIECDNYLKRMNKYIIEVYNQIFK